MAGLDSIKHQKPGVRYPMRLIWKINGGTCQLEFFPPWVDHELKLFGGKPAADARGSAMSDMPDFHSNKEPFEVVFSPWREDLAKRIIKRLHEKGVQVSYSKMKYNTFATGEILPDVPQSVRGKHVYFLHDLLAEDPNIALMRYLLSADALTRSDIASITRSEE